MILTWPSPHTHINLHFKVRFHFDFSAHHHHIIASISQTHLNDFSLCLFFPLTVEYIFAFTNRNEPTPRVTEWIWHGHHSGEHHWHVVLLKVFKTFKRFFLTNDIFMFVFASVWRSCAPRVFLLYWFLTTKVLKKFPFRSSKDWSELPRLELQWVGVWFQRILRIFVLCPIFCTRRIYFCTKKWIRHLLSHEQIHPPTHFTKWHFFEWL